MGKSTLQAKSRVTITSRQNEKRNTHNFWYYPLSVVALVARYRKRSGIGRKAKREGDCSLFKIVESSAIRRAEQTKMKIKTILRLHSTTVETFRFYVSAIFPQY